MHHSAIELHVNSAPLVTLSIDLTRSVAARDDGVLRSGDLGIAVSAILSHAMVLTMSERGLRVVTSRGENGHMPFCV
jgi:hypothetical protein